MRVVLARSLVVASPHGEGQMSFLSWCGLMLRQSGQNYVRGEPDAADRAAGRNAQGLLRARERRGSSRLEVRGPFCEGWPIYHAVHDPASGTIYAAAASEWHGAGVWRSGDLGESWELSSEGLAYGDGDLKLSKLSGLTVAHGRLLAGAESAGVFESRDGGATWSLLSTLDGQPGRTTGTTRPTSRRATSGCPRSCRTRRAGPLLGGRSGLRHLRDHRRRRVVDAAQPRAARRLAARDPEVGYCVHKLAMSPVDHDRLYQQNHGGMHRSDDGGRSWVEITDGLPTEFGFAAAAHPHDRDSFYVIPLDPGHGRCMPEGRAAVWRTSDAGADLATARSRAAAARRAPGRAPRRARDRRARRAGPLLRHQHRPGLRERGRGRERSEIASYLPAISSVESRCSRSHGRRHPPATLPPLFHDLPRRVEVDAGHRWTRRSSASTSAGPGCATGCASRDRFCATTSTCTSTVSEAEPRNPTRRALAGRRHRCDQRRLTPASEWCRGSGRSAATG